MYGESTEVENGNVCKMYYTTYIHSEKEGDKNMINLYGW